MDGRTKSNSTVPGRDLLLTMYGLVDMEVKGDRVLEIKMEGGLEFKFRVVMLAFVMLEVGRRRPENDRKRSPMTLRVCKEVNCSSTNFDTIKSSQLRACSDQTLAMHGKIRSGCGLILRGADGANATLKYILRPRPTSDTASDKPCHNCCRFQGRLSVPCASPIIRMKTSAMKP